MADFSFMGLGARRSLFTALLCTRLVPKMIDDGWAPRLGEVARTRVTAVVYGYDEQECENLSRLVRPYFPKLADAVDAVRAVKGIALSVHLDGLAADLVLTRNGIVVGAEEFVPYGELWEKLHPLCRWGGRFGDSGHFSVTPDGVRK